MLSKGQGTTMGTYTQLIKALDMDHRPEEAHQFWKKKIGSDLHAVPWDLCKCMISIYYRNNMLENLVKVCNIFVTNSFDNVIYFLSIFHDLNNLKSLSSFLIVRASTSTQKAFQGT